VNIVAVQTDIVWEDKPANFANVRRLLAKAPPPRAALLLLPEMFATGFSMNAQAIAESPGGPTERFLAGLAGDLGVCAVGGAVRRGPDGRAQNQALAVSPAGDLLACYAKMRPFTLGGESAHYAAGERPTAFTWEGCTVAPFICYDLRFPELFRQAAARHRPQLFVVLANWPATRIHHWTRLLQARAIENQAYVVGINRCGQDPHHTYPGRSLVVDYHGEILADAGAGDGCLTARLDLTALEAYRGALPFLEDLRPLPGGSPLDPTRAAS
jgi:predicted amidohydrolase